LGGLLGGGGTGQGGGSDLFGTLGALALGGGLGYLLSNVLSNKSSQAAAGAPSPISMPGSNLGTPQKLASGGVNPGYAMGQPVAPAMNLSSNLGKISTMNPTQPAAPMSPVNTMQPVPLLPGPGPMPVAPAMPIATMQPGPGPMPVAPAMPANPIGQQIPLDQLKSLIGM
jgi:hypothetical protein